MASIKQKTDSKGRTIYQVQASDGRGRRVYRTFRPEPTWSAKTTRRELQKFAAQLENDLKGGRVLIRRERQEEARRAAAKAAKVQTFAQYTERVWLPQKRASSARNTMRVYESALRLHILPALGPSLLGEITPPMLTALFYNVQAEGYAEATQELVWIITGAIFEAAVQDGLLEHDPMKKARRPAASKDTKIERQELAYTADELQVIFQAIQREPLIWRALVLLLASTGIRRGEAAGLQWDCVNFDTGEIVIRRNLQPCKGGTYTTTPKTGRERAVLVPPDVRDLLRQLRQEQPVTVRWVFARPHSTEPMNPNSITAHFAQMGKRYGIEDFHAHKLRHSFASLAIAQGADVAAVAQCLGHAQISTTLAVYTHTNQTAANRAASMVWSALQQPKPEEKKA